MALKLRFLGLSLLCLILVSCVDKDDPYAELPSGNWVFAGGNYSSTVVSKAGSSVHFAQNAADGVWAIFKTQPTTQINTYKIVMGPANSLADDEIVLQIDRGVGDSWYSTGVGNNTATVARDGLGNIRITVPSVPIRLYRNGIMQNDSNIGSCVLIYK